MIQVQNNPVIRKLLFICNHYHLWWFFYTFNLLFYISSKNYRRR